MPIENNPKNQSSVVDRPVSFNFRHAVGTVRIKVEVIEGSEILATYYEDVVRYDGSNQPFFDIDVRKILEKNVFPKPGTRTPIFTPDVSSPHNLHFKNTIIFFLRIYAITEDSNGLLQVSPTVTHTSALFRAVNTIWQDEEGWQILATFFEGANRKPLIDHMSVDLYPNETYQLVYFNENQTPLTVTITKFVNGSQSGSPTTFNIANVADADTFTMAIGTRDLNIGSEIDYYEVSAPGMETFTVFVNDGVCTDKTMRLHWLNKRGGFDAYTFNARKIRKSDVESERHLRPIVWDNTQADPHVKGQKGLIKLQIDEFETYEVVSRLELEEDDLVWIKEVFSSAEVYAEMPGVDHLVPVFVENKDSVVVDDTDKVSLQVAAKVTIGTRIISHSN